MKKEKSKYELKLENLIRKSTSFQLTDEENLQIHKDLNKDMEEFLLKEKQINTKTILEAKTVIVGINTSI